jgi:hypothetical protein
MARRTVRILRVQVSFETTRLGAQHLIDAYARLVPPLRRRRSRSKRSEARTCELKVANAKGRS